MIAKYNHIGFSKYKHTQLGVVVLLNEMICMVELLNLAVLCSYFILTISFVVWLYPVFISHFPLIFFTVHFFVIHWNVDRYICAWILIKSNEGNHMLEGFCVNYVALTCVDHFACLVGSLVAQHFFYKLLLLYNISESLQAFLIFING